MNTGIFINGLHNGAECTPGKFVYSTKLRRVVGAQDGHVVIQKDIHRPENTKSHVWGGIILHTSTSWSWLAGKQLCRKGPGGPGRQVERESAVCPLRHRRPTAPWAALGIASSTGWGRRWSFPSSWPWWNTSGLIHLRLHILAGNFSYAHRHFEHAEVHSTHVKWETCSWVFLKQWIWNVG